MLCCPEVGILCIALERKEVSKMAQYVVDMQMEKQEKFYFIREKESMDIVLLPSKYLMHKKRSRISPNTIRRSAFALSYYLNYMDENQLHLDDVYQMKYAEQHEHFTDFLIWLKAGEHSREEYSKLPNNETCNAMLRRLEEKTGIKASPHMLRHYFANERRKDGWKLELISQALGHRNIETTMKYLNITDEELIQVSDEFYSKHQAMYGIQDLL